MSDLINQLERCRTRAVPLVAVNTIDVLTCHSSIKEEKETKLYQQFKYGYTYNMVTGVEYMVTDPTVDDGAKYIETAKQELGAYLTKPVLALQTLQIISREIKNSKVKDAKCVFIMFLADRIVTEQNPEVPPIIFELLVLREMLKKQGSMLILFGNMFNLPRELSDNIYVIDEGLPTLEQRLQLVDKTIEGCVKTAKKNNYEPKAYTDAEKKDLAEAISGQSIFGAEQGLWLSAEREGIILEQALTKKYQMISATDGLSVYKSDGRGFDALGGLSNIKNYFKKLASGKMNVRVVVKIDEIEKTLAGSGGKGGTDSSGVSTSFLGSLLSFMQDKNCYGSLFTGVYGAGKSAVTKAIGDETNSITIEFDLSSMKGSLVGESEARMRRALQVIEAVAGDSNILFVASCNRIEQLPPELRRRFNLGTFFFYFPDTEERKVIWDIYMNKYGISGDHNGVDDTDWTGAEIETCCRNADLMQCSLVEASRYITPVSQTAREEIADLVAGANGRYLSTSHEGFFNIGKVKAKAKAAATFVDEDEDEREVSL